MNIIERYNQQRGRENRYAPAEPIDKLIEARRKAGELLKKRNDKRVEEEFIKRAGSEIAAAAAEELERIMKI